MFRNTLFSTSPHICEDFQTSKVPWLHVPTVREYKLKINVLDQHLNMAGQASLKLKDNYKAVSITMCDKGDQTYHNLKCIKRQCEECGVHNINKRLSSVQSTTLNKPVIWNKWGLIEYDYVQNGKTIMKKKKGMIIKPGTIKDLLAELIADLGSHSLHLFTWRWQARQFKSLKEDLPAQWVLSVAVWDFAENFTCFYQDEAQSCYWARDQATIHPVVTYYACQVPNCSKQVSESIVFISDDRKHDFDAVHQYMDLVAIHLQQKRHLHDIDNFVRFSDGCVVQYKSKGPISDVVHASAAYSFKINHNHKRCSK